MVWVYGATMLSSETDIRLTGLCLFWALFMVLNISVRWGKLAITSPSLTVATSSLKMLDGGALGCWVAFRFMALITSCTLSSASFGSCKWSFPFSIKILFCPLWMLYVVDAVPLYESRSTQRQYILVFWRLVSVWFHYIRLQLVMNKLYFIKIDVNQT